MIFSKLVSAALLIATALGATWQDEITMKDFKKVTTFRDFEEYRIQYNKVYSSIEEESRKYLVWLDNMKTIALENTKGKSYTLRANQFTDLTSDEFRLYVHGTDGACFKPDDKLVIDEAKPELIDFPGDDLQANPTSIDWRSKGVVTPVKNQGQCGSCWAFSATGAMECDYAIKTGKLTSLSEQELVDCCHLAGSSGCNGGQMYAGMEYAAQNGGLCSESEYRYTARDGTCKKSSCGTKYDAPTGTGYKSVTRDSASAMENAVVQGCVSIGIEADQTAFQHYSGGVLTGNCGTRIDHGVLIVGYGVESGEKYWLVKNSWGTSWGEQGYVKICKECNKNGAAGECGILKEGNVPTY